MNIDVVSRRSCPQSPLVPSLRSFGDELARLFAVASQALSTLRIFRWSLTNSRIATVPR